MADPATRTAVVVPVRSFVGAKARLSPVLDADQRAELVRALADRVVTAAGPAPVIVVTADDEVAAWATARGAQALADDGRGLDGAAAAGVAQARQLGHARAAVVHADLPLVTDLAPLLAPDGIALAPDRRRDGTNAIALPTDIDFRFTYGPGSFARHRAEAERGGSPATVVQDLAIAFDVDTPEDLADLTAFHHDIAVLLRVAVGPRT